VLIALLPKPEDGDRPIGLLPGLQRMASRWIRWIAGKPWGLHNSRSYVFGGRGASCESCAWRMAMNAEVAETQGKFSGSSLLDLVKAYERVNHRALRVVCCDTGFSLGALRMLLHVYRAPRTIVIKGVATKVVQTTKTIIAGCNNATTLLRALLIGPMDALCRNWASLRVGVMVDDIQLRSIRTTAKDVDDELRETEVSLEGDLRGCQLETAEKKRQLIAGCPLVAAACKKKPRNRKTHKRHAKNLGVDYAGGRRLGHRVRWSRLQNMRRRIQRLKRLRRAGVATYKLVATSLKPGMLYGIAATGAGDAFLNEVRKAARAGSRGE